MEVPDFDIVATGLPIHADMMLTPGAKTATTDPKLENGAMTLLESTAPTAIAVGTCAGEKMEASSAEFPLKVTKN
jgi:Ni,Fe-hydrogenase III small subunit